MKSRTRRSLLHLLLLMVLIATVLSGCSGARWGSVKWSLSKDGTLLIRGNGPMGDVAKESDVPWYKKRDQIRSVVIEDGVTDIAFTAFYRCANLEHASIAGSVTKIAGEAFGDCRALSDIVLPDGLKTIGHGAFQSCEKLENITIPEGVTEIGDTAFGNCKALTSVRVPKGVTRIEYGAFNHCKALTSIEIPDRVTEIGDNAFSHCTALTSITIPAGVTSLHAGAFDGCTNLDGIDVDPDNPVYVSVDGAVFTKDLSKMQLYPTSYIERNKAGLPAALLEIPEKVVSGESLPKGTLDAAAVLSDPGVRVVPVDPNGKLKSDFYFLLPEDRRSIKRQETDYVLLQTRRYDERFDYVWAGTTDQADKRAFDTITIVYLCAPDGSFAELCRIRHQPPPSGMAPLYGAEAAPEEIWKEIEPLFDLRGTAHADAAHAAAKPAAEDGAASGRPAASLTTALYSNIVKEGTDNFIFSPYSMKDAFSILYPAAEGRARDEIEGIFGFRDGTTVCRDIDRDMLFDGKTGVKAVNKAYVNPKGIDPEDLHPEVLDTDLLEVTEFDAKTYKVINSFVEENTNQKIKDLLMPSDITEKTQSVLVNCLYFLKSWEHKEQKIEWKPTGKSISAFGDDASENSVKEDGKIDILRLPYDRTDEQSDSEHEYAMYIICDAVDSENNGVDQYIGSMTDEELAEVLDFNDYDGLEGYTSVDWTVPCFEMEYRRTLKKDLLKLGMTECFDPQTECFRKFAPVYIDEVIQKCFVRADETGTEAAAATAIVMNKWSMMEFRRPKHIVADHEFAFAIKDETSGEILFLGRVGNPTYE
ncbi:MAG: leucine-rich repeat protein [Stomatobaculum sp.]|nr:leucine-rich repeat protein [Stomatobaculum sp.]